MLYEFKPLISVDILLQYRYIFHQLLRALRPSSPPLRLFDLRWHFILVPSAMYSHVS